MNKLELEYVQEVIDQEGFDYAFTHYTRFEEVEDKRFHTLRKAFLKAAKNLADYVKVSTLGIED